MLKLLKYNFKRLVFACISILAIFPIAFAATNPLNKYLFTNSNVFRFDSNTPLYTQITPSEKKVGASCANGACNFGVNATKLQQSFLNDMGYKVKVDGIYGPETRNATMQFQKDWNKAHPNDKIAVDGILGAQTRDRMRQSLTKEQINEGVNSVYKTDKPEQVISDMQKQGGQEGSFYNTPANEEYMGKKLQTDYDKAFGDRFGYEPPSPAQVQQFDAEWKQKLQRTLDDPRYELTDNERKSIQSQIDSLPDTSLPQASSLAGLSGPPIAGLNKDQKYADDYLRGLSADPTQKAGSDDPAAGAKTFGDFMKPFEDKNYGTAISNAGFWAQNNGLTGSEIDNFRQQLIGCKGDMACVNQKIKDLKDGKFQDQFDETKPFLSKVLNKTVCEKGLTKGIGYAIEKGTDTKKYSLVEIKDEKKNGKIGSFFEPIKLEDKSKIITEKGKQAAAKENDLKKGEKLFCCTETGLFKSANKVVCKATKGASMYTGAISATDVKK